MKSDETQGTRLSRSRLNLWPLGLILIILGFAFWGDRGVLFLLKLTQQKAALINELEQINNQNAALRHEIGALRNDRRHIERLARTELGMVREDELVFQFSSEGVHK